MAGLELSQELGAWGAEHGGAPFEAQGRAALRRLGAPGCSP